MGLIAGSLALLLVIVGVFGYARYRAAKGWLTKLKQRSGVSIEQETDNYTYSQSLRGRTIFTLRAAKGISHANGTITLHDVVLTVYGASGDRSDRVYGKTFEWDDKQGIARAVGEVQMDLGVPGGVAAPSRRGSPAVADSAKSSIHVKTSGLVFLRKLGVAATQEQIEFFYGGLTCIAQGAEIDSSPDALHLLANVQMNGELHGQPVTLTATKADFDRTSNVAQFTQPLMVTQGRKVRAELAVLHLRKDGSVERAEATGGVTMDADTRHLSGARLDAVLNKDNQPETARLSGGVKMIDTNAVQPAQGEASEMRMRFDAQGRPAEITALGGAHLLSRQVAADGTSLARELHGDQVLATFHADGKAKPQLQQMHVTGAASMRGESLARATSKEKAGMKSATISGDDLLVSFAPDAAEKVHPDKLHALGHSTLRQTGPQAADQVSSADTIDMVFSSAPGKQSDQLSVASATEAGHVSVTNRAAVKPGSKKAQDVTTASAERAAYDGANDRLLLNGGVHLVDAGTSLVAQSVIWNQQTGDAEAHGGVSATMTGSGAQATHIAAQAATLNKETQVAEFTGAAGKPVRMWQEASQVEAATVVLDRLKKTMLAKPAAGGVVRSVFATEGKAKEGTAKGPSILRVESRLLEYSDAQREAVFSGPVKLDGALGEVRGQKTTVYFAPPVKGVAKPSGADSLMSGSLERVLVSGDVKLDEPGRHGTGELLTYKSADGSFILTGTPAAPPRIVDAQQGSLTGASLLFRSAGNGDSTIVVTGAPAVGEQRPTRAHIETRVRQKSE